MLDFLTIDVNMRPIALKLKLEAINSSLLLIACKECDRKISQIIIFRAKEQMELAKRTYEILNSELHDELPALYDSRALFLVTNMQTLFAAEEVFHTETSKVS